MDVLKTKGVAALLVQVRDDNVAAAEDTLQALRETLVKLWVTVMHDQEQMSFLRLLQQEDAHRDRESSMDNVEVAALRKREQNLQEELRRVTHANEGAIHQAGKLKDLRAACGRAEAAVISLQTRLDDLIDEELP